MTANFGKNQNVANTLDAYLKLDKPQFAVLLQGEWGSGKTWFIHNYINQRNNDNQPFCYVSLFGLEKLKEIDDQILASCSPLLSKAESMGRLAGALLERFTSILKTADIEKISEFVKKWYPIPNNLVLVLDDLERATISAERVLGYVNNMLDQVGIKVILLCAPDQMKDQDIFLRFKEKVVGSCMAVVPDAETVFDSQLATITNEEIKKIFQNNKLELLTDFYSSRTMNLRDIKRLFFDFIMCYEKMNQKMKSDSLYLSEFLHLIFIHSIDIRLNSQIDYLYIHILPLSFLYRSQQYQDFRKKADEEGKRVATIPCTFFHKFLKTGTIDETSLLHTYTKSAYAYSKEFPVMIYHKIHTRNYTEDELLLLYRNLSEDISNTKYTGAIVILHAFDILLKFHQLSFDNQSDDDIVEMANRYLHRLETITEQYGIPDINGGYKFLSSRSSKFEEICTAVYVRIKEIHQKQIDSSLKKISGFLPASPDEFIARLRANDTREIQLTRLDAEEFARRVSSVPMPRRQDILETIFHNIDNKKIKAEDDKLWVETFLKTVANNFNSSYPSTLPILEEQMEKFRRFVSRTY